MARPFLKKKESRDIRRGLYFNKDEDARFMRLVKFWKDKQYARTIRRAILEQANRLGIK